MKEQSPQSGNPLHLLRDGLGQTVNLTGSEESIATSLRETGQAETSADGPGHLPALPTPKCTSGPQQKSQRSV